MSTVEEQILSLGAMSSAALRERWSRLTGSPVPQVSPKLLRLALAWEIQATAFGGMSRTVTRSLDQLARGITRTTAAKPGMRLVREWQGGAHVVTVGEDGVISWDGRTWTSLSEVARAITGTRWSGPAFFGLKKKVAA
ncbi:DUF2924 domain-containing protein [Sphingomonas faeni]|uniref:DUF2924 domain-containing protein n=1 Tax=Sphingomonas faeni TaxID=185950 RepID=UPI0020C10D67|nr:DUF2924 domain-containing protein [Sphingomonas faeni]